MTRIESYTRSGAVRAAVEQQGTPAHAERHDIAELSNHKFDTEFTFASIEQSILKAYPNARFVAVRDRSATPTDRANPRWIRDLPKKSSCTTLDLVSPATPGEKLHCASSRASIAAETADCRRSRWPSAKDSRDRSRPSASSPGRPQGCCLPGCHFDP